MTLLAFLGGPHYPRIARGRRVNKRRAFLVRARAARKARASNLTERLGMVFLLIRLRVDGRGGRKIAVGGAGR